MKMKMRKKKNEKIIEDFRAIAYNYDASPFSGRAICVYCPESERDVVEFIKDVIKYRIDVVPRGGGSGLVGGAIPKESVVLDLSKLRSISIDAKRAIAHVGAGVTIAELNREAAKFGLFFPVIPASHEVATIGGAIATNASGLRAVKYGRMANWVKSIRVLDGHGKIISGDIEHFCGSEGIYGIILSAVLRLTPIPKEVSLSLYEFDDLEECINFSFALEGNISALEFLDKYCSKLAFGKEKYTLIVEFEDRSGEITERELMDDIWRKREGLYSLLCKEGFTYIEDPCIPKEKIMEFLKWCTAEGFPVFGHLGARIFHIHFNEERKNRRHGMWRYVNELGGFPGEHGIGIDKKGVLSDSEKEKRKKLKSKYDPLWIFNRGKVIDRKEGELYD
jgi:FAD/FMN-containing dehydrogenase